jgi:hypothetical protein
MERGGVENMNKIITLTALLDDKYKIDILSTVYSKTEEMIMHYDNLRQRNLNIALIIFAGLFGLGIKTEPKNYQVLISIAIILLMLIFFRIDRKFHTRTHGFRGSTFKLLHKIGKIREGEEIKFEKFDDEYAKKAEWKSMHTVIYYFLIIGGIATYFIWDIFMPVK